MTHILGIFLPLELILMAFVISAIITTLVGLRELNKPGYSNLLFVCLGWSVSVLIVIIAVIISTISGETPLFGLGIEMNSTTGGHYEHI